MDLTTDFCLGIAGVALLLNIPYIAGIFLILAAVWKFAKFFQK